MHSERTHVLLSKDQLSRLKHIARAEGRSVGAVIGEAVDAYLTTPEDARRWAIEHLLSLEVPVADWEVMKQEIVAGGTHAL